jgi:hypothetical protein
MTYPGNDKDPVVVLADNDDATGCTSTDQQTSTFYVLSHNFDLWKGIPLGSTITNVKFKMRAAASHASHLYKFAVQKGSQSFLSSNLTFTRNGTFQNIAVDYTTNPATNQPWLPSDFAGVFDASVGVELGFYLTVSNYIYPRTDYISEFGIEVSWTYTPSDADVEQTGVTTSIVDYDDGYYKKGEPKIVVDNADGTISLPSRNLMFAKPCKMIDGTNNQVAGNRLTKTNTTDFGTLSLGMTTVIGKPYGVGPKFGSYLQDWSYSYSPVTNGVIFRDPNTGIIWESRHNSNYSSPGFNPTQPLTSQDWKQIKSHDHIYICKTSHSTPTAPSDYDYMGGHSYTLDEECTYDDYMGGKYWKCTTPFTSTGMWYQDYTNFTDITAAKLATALDASKMVEVTNVASAYGDGAYMPIADTFANLCTYGHDLVFAGHTDWRLANEEELMALVDFNNASTTNPLFAHSWLELPASCVSFHSATPHPASHTDYTIGTDFTGYGFLQQFYQNNYAFGIYVRNIA